MPQRAAARHDAERRAQGVHRARQLHLPAGADDAPDDRPVRVLPRAHPALEHDLDLRLPLPREGLLGRPGGRVHAVHRASPTCRRRSRRASTVDEFAPRLAFFFNGHNNVFQEVAKFRAARRMWAQIMRERFGAQRPEVDDAALPHADRRRDADRPAAGEQHRARRAAGLRGGLRRHAVAAHQRLRRGARAAHRARREDRAAHAADPRARVGRGRHRRPVRRLLLRRVADRRDRSARAAS